MMALRSPTLLALLATFGIGSALTAADVPGLLPYQGRVQDNGVNLTGTAQFKFALVDGAGTVLWQNDVDSAVNGTPGFVSSVRAAQGGTPANAEPALAVTLPVINGIFNILLGDTTQTNMKAIPPEIFNNAEVYLRVWVNPSATGAFTEVTPAVRLAASPYALRAATAATVDSGSIGVAQLKAIPPSGSDQVLTSNGTTLSWTAKSAGVAGPRGSQWFVGAGNPAFNQSPELSSAQSFDLYLDSEKGEVHQYDGDSWTKRTTLSGVDGAPGAPGSQWHSGSGDPNSFTEGPLFAAPAGDLYLDFSNGSIYQSSGSTWSVILSSIVGPKGNAGAKWYVAGVDADSFGIPADAVSGDLFFDSSAGTIYKLFTDDGTYWSEISTLSVNLSNASNGVLPISHGGTGGDSVNAAKISLEIPLNKAIFGSPSSSDNSTAGYLVGSLWADKETGDIWLNVGEVLGGGEAPTLNAQWQRIGNAITLQRQTPSGTDNIIPVTGPNGTIDPSFVPVMIGAGPLTPPAPGLLGGGGGDGQKGLVPQPLAGDNNKVLHGDGTWAPGSRLTIKKLAPGGPLEPYTVTDADELIVVDVNAPQITFGEGTPVLKDSSLIILPDASAATNKGRVLRIKVDRNSSTVFVKPAIDGQMVDELPAGPNDSIRFVSLQTFNGLATLVCDGEGHWYAADGVEGVQAIVKPIISLGIGTYTSAEASSFDVDGQSNVFVGFHFAAPSLPIGTSFNLPSSVTGFLTISGDAAAFSDFTFNESGVVFNADDSITFSDSAYIQISLTNFDITDPEPITWTLEPSQQYSLNSSYSSVTSRLVHPPLPTIGINGIGSAFQESLTPDLTQGLGHLSLTMNGLVTTSDYRFTISPISRNFIIGLQNGPGFLTFDNDAGEFILSMPSTSYSTMSTDLYLILNGDATVEALDSVTLTLKPSSRYNLESGRESISFTIQDPPN